MVTRGHKLKKDRQYNGQKQKDKKTNNNSQNITQNIKDWATRTPQKKPGDLCLVQWLCRGRRFFFVFFCLVINQM